MGLRQLADVLPLRLRALFRRGMLEEQLDDEFQYHIEQEIAYRMRQGESRDGARANALRDFGSVERYKDEVRDTRRVERFEELVRDTTFALRSLRRAKLFTAVAVGTLALAIGANSAVFSLIDAVLLHPLDVAYANRLVAITQAITDEVPRSPLSFPAYRAMASRARWFTGIAAFATLDAVVTTAGDPQRLAVSAASGNYFDVLGLRPQVGRLLSPRDDSAPGENPVAVLSDGLWTRAYNRNRDVVGSVVKIGGSPFTVVGVAPKAFRGTRLNERPDLWVPATMLADLGLGGFLSSAGRSVLFTLPHFLFWNAIGRVRGGTPPSRAAAELNAIFAQETEKRPPTTGSQMGFVGRDIVGDAIRLTSLNEAAAWGNRDDLVRFMGILAAVVVLTLLIACFNLANLLLIRNSDRALELSVRSSLGASRSRLVQQLAVESLILGLAGAGTGILVGRAGTRLVASFALPGGISLQDVALGLNGRVLSATMALGVLTTLIFGLAPIIHASRTDLIATLRSARSTVKTDARAILLGCEIALSIVLLVGAGLFIRTLQKALETNLGFEAAPLAAVRVNPSMSGYSGAQLAEYYRDVVDRASRIPGVTGVALSTQVPLAAHGHLPFVPAEKSTDGADRAGDQVSAGWVYVSPTYFAVLGVPMLEGRAFTPNDAARSDSIAIINQAAAHALFPDGHSIGREIVHAGMMRFSIVGVVRDTKYSSVSDERVPMVFTPMAPDFNDDVNVIVRSQKPTSALDALRRLAQSMPPHPPVQDVRLVADQVNNVLEPQRFGATLLAMYSVLALVIASVGVYGVLAYIVEGRKREIGIRIALGAQPGKVVELITIRVASIAIVGVLAGLLASTLVTRALSRFLYGVTATDIPTFAVAAAAMLLASLCACVLPALRALRIDPATAMRFE